MTLSDEVVIERTVLQDLRGGPGHASLQNLFDEIAKLERLRALSLPADFLKQFPIKILQHYKQRVNVEEPHELRRHPAPLRFTLLTAFSYLREQELTDTLIDLLLGTIHRIGARAERRVERELIQDLKRVAGKHRLLFEIADASLLRPDGLVKEVVFPIAGEPTLRELVKEWKSSGPAYRNKVQTVVRNTYRSHYRRMLPRLLAALEFRSNNERYQPVIEALGLLKKYATTKIQFYPAQEDVPVEGVVKALCKKSS